MGAASLDGFVGAASWERLPAAIHSAPCRTRELRRCAAASAVTASLRVEEDSILVIRGSLLAQPCFRLGNRCKRSYRQATIDRNGFHEFAHLPHLLVDMSNRFKYAEHFNAALG